MPLCCSPPGIAIFCMLLTYYMWIKAVKTGSVYWSSMCALAYFYMVRNEGGNVFCRVYRSVDETFVLVVGFLLGWLCLPDQPDPSSRPGPDAHRKVFSPHLCGLLHSLLPGHHPVHANIICWFPGQFTPFQPLNPVYVCIRLHIC